MTAQPGDGGMEVGNYGSNNHVQSEDLYYPTLQYPPLQQDLSAEDWCYYARRTSQEIIPGLYLGPYSSATKSSKENLQSIGITHIVCVRSACEDGCIRTNHPDTFSYLVVELNDTLFQGIIPQLKTVITFLDDCFKTGGRALVHGNAGMSRSAAMVVGYVMWRHGVDARKAFKFVQSKRFCISINDSYMSQLIDFETCVRAVHDVPVNPETNPYKRQMEDDVIDSSGKRYSSCD